MFKSKWSFISIAYQKLSFASSNHSIREHRKLRFATALNLNLHIKGIDCEIKGYAAYILSQAVIQSVVYRLFIFLSISLPYHHWWSPVLSDSKPLPRSYPSIELLFTHAEKALLFFFISHTLSPTPAERSISSTQATAKRKHFKYKNS